jgi:L-lactate dehydrogenase (cytochrome)
VNPTIRRLSRTQTIWDLRKIAKRRVPPAVFDYTDGAAEHERSLSRAREAFNEIVFRPSVLRDVSRVSLATQVLGRPSALPFGLAPTGFTRMMHHEGETAVAAVAEEWEIPYSLSTMGTTSIEDVAVAAPDARKWFQLYVWSNRDDAAELISRARIAGYEALILTVDVPVAGARLRDARNGFSIPPTLTLKTVFGAAIHPGWWINLLTTTPLTFASLSSWDRTVGELIDELFDPSMTLADLAWIRSLWSGPLIVKGIQTVEDAKRLSDLGVDALVVSNHGGRQLDRSVVPFLALPKIRKAVPSSVEVWVDTGVMSGGDIVACLANGADFVLIGRAYLYGLMAGGQRGVDRSIQILADEIQRTMQLLGVTNVAELDGRCLASTGTVLPTQSVADDLR